MKRLLKKSNFKVMPWKNGKGITSEITIFPQGTSIPANDFHWRLSCAQVNADGPFSVFPGYDRILTVINGRGLKLNQRQLTLRETYSFPGDQVIESSLIDGPVVDFGIIYRRNLYNCTMSWEQGFESELVTLEPGTHFFKAHTSGLIVDSLPLPVDDVLEITNQDQFHIKIVGKSIDFLKISIFKRGANESNSI